VTLETRRVLEGIALAGSVAAPVLAIGAVATEIPLLLTLAAAALAAAIAAGRNIVVYEEVLSAPGEGERRRQIRYWTTLKVAGIIVHVLVILAILVIVVAALLRADVLAYETQAVTQETVPLGTHLFTALLVAGLSTVHHLSMMVPLARTESPFGGLTGLASLASALLFAAAVHVVATGAVAIGPLVVSPADGPYLHLAATGLAGVGLVSLRSPPTLGLVLVGEQAYYRGHTSLSRERSVAAPVALSLALLLTVLFGGVVLLVGVGDFLGLASRNAAVGGVVALVAMGIMATLAAAVFLWQTGREVPLYQAPSSTVERMEKAILGGSAVLGLVPAVVGALLLAGQPVLGLAPRQALPMIGVAVLVWTGPPGYWYHRKQARVRALEAKFPDFLRDTASSRQAGLTLEKAIRVAGRSEYGALDPEVDKMADQLSWNVNFEEALRRFAARVDTPLVRRAVVLIDEADHAGGDVTSILMAAARDAREVKNLEEERRTNMSLYTVVIYVAFLVFLGVTAAMFATFIPQIVEASDSIGGGGGLTGISVGGTSVDAYRNFYLTVAFVQAVGSGIVAGYVETGEITAGLKHVFIMVAITLVAFILLV
jgi:flagellar protein FlaJ